nr:hypothetical protein [Tanacetum cinerariifolium]
MMFCQPDIGYDHVARNTADNASEGEKLATAKKIKLDYMGDTIMFSLPLKSGTTYLWRNVTERFSTLNKGAFQIKYYDYYGSLRTISTDADLQACLADPNSMGNLAIKPDIGYDHVARNTADNALE